jgi:nicotinamidase-related amidase
MIRGLQLGDDGAFAPLLICANLQSEPLPAEPAGIEDRVALDRCAVLLARWRWRRWPVAHLRRIARPSWFGPQRDQWDWIDGFNPRPGELTFAHALPSAFSSMRFAAYVHNIRPSPNFLVGCSLDQTILATAIDGYHRGHQFHVVEDAVLCAPRANAPGEPAACQSTVLHILEVFGEGVRSEAVITASSQLRSSDALAAHSNGGSSQ